MLLLDGTGVGDKGAEIIATSLKHNIKLTCLGLRDDGKISEKGQGALLKLLNDVSSIESTYNSNHTLTDCKFTSNEREMTQLIRMINHACAQNKHYSSSPEAVRRAKIIETQLNSETRKQYCQWQGTEYSSIGYLLSDIDIEPVYLPNIFEAIGLNHDVSSFYTALVPTAPDLLSFVDRKVMLKDAIDVNVSDTAALDAECERQVAALKARFSH